MAMSIGSGHLTTSDGVRLSYLEAGSGPPLVLIPGWSQTAEQFKHQLDGLSDRYRVIAIDMRGHGDSDKPASGYRIARIAKDVHDALEALNLENVNLLGHSMGCSVIWSYWDTFGSDRLSKLILVDQPPFLTSNPVWSEAELEASGAIFTAESVYATYNALMGPDAIPTTNGFVGGMVTSAIDPAVKEWIIALNHKMTRPHAATLLYNHCTQDWRDVIPGINLPTLIISGRVSLVPWKSQVWINQQIKGSQLEIFEEDEGGQHFMFIENPAKFNKLVADFIG